MAPELKTLCDHLVLVAANKTQDKAAGVQAARNARKAGVTKSDVQAYFSDNTDFKPELIDALLAKYDMLVLAEKMFTQGGM